MVKQENKNKTVKNFTQKKNPQIDEKLRNLTKI